MLCHGVLSIKQKDASNTGDATKSFTLLDEVNRGTIKRAVVTNSGRLT